MKASTIVYKINRQLREREESNEVKKSQASHLRLDFIFHARILQ